MNFPRENKNKALEVSFYIPPSVASVLLQRYSRTMAHVWKQMDAYRCHAYAHLFHMVSSHT